ncbi:MAG: hypothetical protein Pars2KO_14270 [Parasphingorhabdus sp.]
MIVQLLLLAVAFFGAWLVLQPTEHFTYDRKAGEGNAVTPTILQARSTIGYILCIAALSAILLMQV